VNQWFRGELGGPARRLLLSSTALDRGYFREEGLRRLLDEHAGGRNHGPRLWALVCLELWFRIYFDQSDLSRWDVGDADYCAWLSLEGLA
jgi:asparagine synthase (glutamine-hydrolysing)